MRTANGNAYKNTGSGWENAGAQVPMLHTARETAAGSRERQSHSDSRRHSAAGAATLTAPVGAGVHARRVRAAGAAVAAVVAGVGWPGGGGGFRR